MAEIEQPFLSGTAAPDAGLGKGQLTDQVWEEVRRAIKLSNQTEAFWDHLLAFVHAVDWTVRPALAMASTAAAVSYVGVGSLLPWLHTCRRTGSEASWRGMWPSSCWCCCAGETPPCSQACSCC